MTYPRTAPVYVLTLSLLGLNMTSRLITVNDRMQRGYTYRRIEPVGRNFDNRFVPQPCPCHHERRALLYGSARHTTGRSAECHAHF